ncbi:MAG: signal peptidase I [Ilumatobacter sp.]
METEGRSAVDLLTTGIRIVVWTFANLTFLLGAWVLIGWLLAGWSPVVIMSDSMRPTLDAGDVVLIEADERIGQREVIVFERDETLIAHRVFAVEGDELITKGDANASPDTDPVAREDVIGSGRLVIPLVGLPLVWAQSGDWAPFAAWGLLTGAGVVGIALALDRVLRRRRSSSDRSAEFAVARVGIQRVRVLTAVLLIGQLLISRGDGFSLSDTDTILSLGAVGVLFATNFLASAQPRRGKEGGRAVAVIELLIDTVLVVVLTTSTDDGLSWILFALPIIEAAVRFRLVGALVHWTGLTMLTLAVEIASSNARGSQATVQDLESLLDQLGVLFLFVIPAAYLAEQLLGEVTTWQRATGHAHNRSELLARVADVGRDVARLDGRHVDVILTGVKSMGFDRADIVARSPGGGWRVVAGAGLPVPGRAASCTRVSDLGRRSSIVTPNDPDAAEAAALEQAGLVAVVSQVISDQNGRFLVLRVAVDAGKEFGAEHIEAFRLLAGQATVALQNDELMTEVTSMHDELEHRALHDGLTGLPNRTMLLRGLREARTLRRPVAVLFLDLDGFKPVNDRLGHDVGDVLLERVARRLQEAASSSALVGRLGGDEFTVVLTGSDSQDAMELADKIVAEIRRPFEIGDQMIHISTSVGVAFGAEEADDAELVRRADVAMYEAKHGPGSGSIEAYRSELDLQADRRAQLTIDIRHAISAGTLHLAYQAFVDLRVDRVVGVEALIRWDHPEFGRIPPGETVDAALGAGVSAELNRFIVRTAIEWVSHAQKVTGTPDLFVAVNASPEELNSPGLAHHLVSVARDAGVTPSAVAVEISERVVTPVSETAQKNMEDLQAEGVRLLLDDFGEGTTSLTYLQELPIDGVKLDRRLVVNAMRSRTDRLVLESIVSLSQSIGLTVIAEGIEAAEHLEAVQQAGCQLVQGYLLHRPMGGDELVAVLADQPAFDRGSGGLGENELFGDHDWTRPLFGPDTSLDHRVGAIEPDPPVGHRDDAPETTLRRPQLPSQHAPEGGD